MRLRAWAAAFGVTALAACGGTQEGARRAPERAAISVPSAQPAGKEDGIALNTFERSIIDATNAFRVQNGFKPLRPTAKLLLVAQGHARNMARQDRFGDSDKNGHVLDGRNVEYRIKVSGYVFSRVAENVGFELRRRDPVGAMMEGWKNSPGHRKNMLHPDVTELGVGAAQGKSGRWYFAQVFGAPLEPPRRQALVDMRRDYD